MMMMHGKKCTTTLVGEKKVGFSWVDKKQKTCFLVVNSTRGRCHEKAGHES